MKKTITRLAAILVMCALAIAPACKKAEKGDKGDKGDTGATGATGTAGSNGSNGTNGNAQVYGYFFTENLSAFTLNSTNNAYELWVNPAPITGTVTIGDKDEVLLYFNDAAATGLYNTLPYLDYFNTGSAFNQHSFKVESMISVPPNWINLSIRNSGGNQPYSTMSGTLYYKIVIVKSVNMEKPKLPADLSYESVKKYYGLKD